MRSALLLPLVVLGFTACTSSAPGRLVDVGGRRLHIRCVGSGSPTVVFESGLGEGFYVWALVQDEVGRRFRACSYDRSGIGFSDPDAAPRSIARLNEDLHALLSRAGERGPYLLVGHSLGGTMARRYAMRYPSEVAALVLVDSAHEDGRRTGTPEIREAVSRRLAARAEQLKAWHASGKFETMAFDERVPRDLVRMLAPRTATASWWDARYAENLLPDSQDELTPEQRRLGVPLIVITATKYVPPPPDYPEESWKENYRRRMGLQKELASRSPRSKHVLVDTDHSVQLASPQAVIAAIVEAASMRE